MVELQRHVAQGHSWKSRRLLEDYCAERWNQSRRLMFDVDQNLYSCITYGDCVILFAVNDEVWRVRHDLNCQQKLLLLWSCTVFHQGLKRCSDRWMLCVYWIVSNAVLRLICRCNATQLICHTHTLLSLHTHYSWGHAAPNCWDLTAPNLNFASPATACMWWCH